MADNTARGKLQPILFPRSVAIVGASATPGKLGHTITMNMIDGGFDGPIYPVNPRESELLGRPCFPNLSAVSGPVDLVVVVVPGRNVLPVIEEAVGIGAGGAIIVSAGFSEMGEEGVEIEGRLQAISRDVGMPIIGPNCQGVLSARGRVTAWFGPKPERAGHGLFVSQSGGLAGTLIGRLNRAGVPLFDTVVSLGNKCSIDEADLLDAAAEDPEIGFAMAYIEGFAKGRGRAFFDAASRFQAQSKTIVVLKGGRSGAGERATASHTGSLAGSDRVFSSAMRQAGISLAESVRSFIDIARLIAVQATQRQGHRVLILTNLGGPGVITADLCVKHGLDVSPASETLQRALRDSIPQYCAVRNPIDLAGDPAPERYKAILEEVYASAEYDGVIVVAAPLIGDEQVARDLVSAYQSSTIPTAVCWMGDLAGTNVEAVLESGGLPVFEMPEDAVRAFAGILS